MNDKQVIKATASLQQHMARALQLIGDVVRGPDAKLRAQAIDRLYEVADMLNESSARLGEFTDD